MQPAGGTPATFRQHCEPGADGPVHSTKPMAALTPIRREVRNEPAIFVIPVEFSSGFGT
jgi:hypothetical protein